MKRVYKEYRVAYVFLLVILVILLFSCEKNNKTSASGELPQLVYNYQKEYEETRNKTKEPFPSVIKTRTPGQAYDDYDDSRELPPPPPPSPVIPFEVTLLYKYDGYWSMRHEEYFKLDDRNKYEKRILFLKIFKNISELYERLKCKLKIKENTK